MASSNVVWLRRADDKDKDYLLNIRNQNSKFFEDTRFIQTYDHNKWMERNIPGSMHIIMINNNKAGTISIDLSTGEIGNVIISQNYRGKGFFIQAMAIAECMIKAYAVTKHAKYAIVKVRADNQDANAIYEKLGYNKTVIIREKNLEES